MKIVELKKIHLFCSVYFFSKTIYILGNNRFLHAKNNNVIVFSRAPPSPAAPSKHVKKSRIVHGKNNNATVFSHLNHHLNMFKI